MKRYIQVAVVLMLAAFASLTLYAADWSNPNPYSGDKAGPLLLKHEDNMTDLYNGASSKLNQLRDNFAGSASPSSPNTGQGWYDTTNHYYQFYDSVCGGWYCGGFRSSGTSSLDTLYSSNAIITGGTISTSGTNTLSGQTTLSNAVITGGTISTSGTVTLSNAVITGGTISTNGTVTLSNAVITGGTISTGGTITANLIGNVTGTATTATNLAMTGEATVSGASSPQTINLGNVTAGDRILVFADHVFAYGTSTRDVRTYLSFTGSATWALGVGSWNYANIAEFANASGASSSSYVICGTAIIKITGSGTLSISANASAITSTGYSLSSLGMHVFFLKKQ